MDAKDTGSAAAETIRCQECGRVWQDGNERWRTYVTDDDPPQAVSYCAACAEREFGERRP
jgi:hypothetical protein